MTEQEAFNDPEMKVILLLSGYVRELREGRDFETTTNETARKIIKITKVDVCCNPDIKNPEDCELEHCCYVCTQFRKPHNTCKSDQ